MSRLPGWKEINLAAIVFDAGNTSEYHTGDWRSMRPEVDHDKCVKCARCWMYCPDACLVRDDEGYYSPDYNYCKGCGICARECPREAIVMVEECE